MFHRRHLPTENDLTMFNQQSLNSLFCPASIAVVGASATPQKIGAVPLTLLRKFGYGGKIYPVNPKADEIQGLKSYPSIAAIDAPVDLAILAVPAAMAYQALEDAGSTQLKNAVMFTSGYAETGETGRIEQARLATLAADRGVRL
jgi:acyl-CoA synthetase (NDP forming)